MSTDSNLSIVDTDKGSALPRPEYPRPQFVRDTWLSLNGEWEFEFDDGDVGVKEGWSDGRTLARRITVPFAYQTKLSGIDDTTIHECVWYARTFSVPTEWKNTDVLLNFGAVDYETTVWINGQEVGHHQGGHVPFQFEIAPYMKEGENRLVVRVEDRQDLHQPRGKQSYTGLPHGIDYYCTTGIWQTVWLEKAPPIRIEELRVITHAASNRITLDVFLHAPSAPWRIEVEVLSEGATVVQVEGHTAIATGHFDIQIPFARLWSPEDPHLYDLKVRLYENDHLHDEIKAYVGLRSIELRNGKFLLNGQPIYLKFVLDQGYWPDGFLTAPSDEALQTDIGWVKMFGFNGVRKHQKLEDPRYLYWADKLGLLVWEEMPSAYRFAPRAITRMVKEWTEAIERDYSHPCIIVWVPFNESWGVPNLTLTQAHRNAVEALYHLTRTLDSTRPVIGNDGWEASATDILGIHDYDCNPDKLKARYEVSDPVRTLFDQRRPGGRILTLDGFPHRGQPIVLTEFGGIAYDPNATPEDGTWGYTRAHTAESYHALYQRLLKVVNETFMFSGFCYTQFADTFQEANGLLNADRTPKLPFEVISAATRNVDLEPKDGEEEGDRAQPE